MKLGMIGVGGMGRHITEHPAYGNIHIWCNKVFFKLVFKS